MIVPRGRIKSMCMWSETMEQGNPCSKKDGTTGIQIF